MKVGFNAVLLIATLFVSALSGMHVVQGMRGYLETAQNINYYGTMIATVGTTLSCIGKAKSSIDYVRQEYGEYITMQNCLYAVTAGIGVYFCYRYHHLRALHNKLEEKKRKQEQKLTYRLARVEGGLLGLHQKLTGVSKNVVDIRKNVDTLTAMMNGMTQQLNVVQNNGESVLASIRKLQEEAGCLKRDVTEKLQRIEEILLQRLPRGTVSGISASSSHMRGPLFGSRHLPVTALSLQNNTQG